MIFILSGEFIPKLSNLRPEYEERTKIPSLKDAPQPYAITRFFGAKDVESRDLQISLFEEFLAGLLKDFPMPADESFNKKNFLRALKREFHSPKASNFNAEKYLTALKVLVALCFYTKFQIDKTYTLRSAESAILGQLLDEAMGLTSLNAIDEESKACCLLGARRFLKASGSYEEINACLNKPISELQWKHFSDFVAKECKLLDKKYIKNFYPMTSLMMPVFAKPMELTGYAAGFVFGGILAESSLALHTRYVLTASISGCILVIAPSASIGVMLFVPAIAGRFLDATLGISSAWLMGTSMKMVGKGIGFGVGMSLDLSMKLLYKAYSLLVGLSFGKSHQEKLTGISLIDGRCFIEGALVEVVELDNLTNKLSANNKEYPVTFEVIGDELIISVNEQKARIVLNRDDQSSLIELQKVLDSQQESLLTLTSEVVSTEATPVTESFSP